MANPYQGDDVDPFSAVRDEEGNIKRDAPAARSLAKKPEPKKQSFGQAFAAARKAGDKTFMFNGKKYTTRTKEDDEKAAPKSEAPKRKSVSTAGDIASKNAEQLSSLMKTATKKVPARPPVSTAGAIASRNFKSGGSVSSCSKRADGVAQRGKTKCRIV
jgi:hypothetical protein